MDEPLCRILVAEDDPAIRRLLGATLRRRRLEVELAENGALAIDALKKGGDFSVLVLDLNMPHVDGWEVLRWLAKHPERRPESVIVVSATDREALSGLDYTIVNAIIFKPFDVVQLGAYIKGAAQQGRRDRRRGRVVARVE